MAVVSRRALRDPETFDAWLAAAGEAARAFPHGALPPCPNCGRYDLTLRYVADARTGIGFAVIWSERCRHGIRLSRVTVPEGVDFLPSDAPDDRIATALPDDLVEIRPSR